MIPKDMSFLIIFLTINTFRFDVEAVYYVGVGRADSTGPAVGVTLMGYADLKQQGCGIHTRQFSRAFIFNDTKTTVTFITVDTCMMNHPVKQAVIDKLAAIFPENIFTLENTIISGTHTHSTPGGEHKDVLLDISTFGFVRESFDAMINGIVRSVQRAYSTMEEARIFVNSGELLDTNINRSPASYLFNPEDEVKKYKYNVDKDMVQVKITRTSDNGIIGAINWFPVHGTSMNHSNCLLSSDNLGYASILLESSINIDYLPGQGSFVGAFASTSQGDVSPNTKGPICINTGKACDFVHSTCNGNCEVCIASGPGKDMFESTEIIATNLFKKSKDLLEDTSANEILGDIRYIHRFTNMSNQTVKIHQNGSNITVQGCLPALGYGFAAGTTDGPGQYPFAQAKVIPEPLWDLARNIVLAGPTKEDVECHHPKRIFLMTGRMRHLPYEWQPEVVATQIVRIGQLFLTAVPGEFTTMSGRRLREAVYKEVIANGGSNDTKVIIAGYSNVYTNYIATPEEYQLQRYEGASTIFGPHTLTIYLKLYSELTTALLKGNKVKDDGNPYKFPENLISMVLPVIFDSSGSRSFGDCAVQPKSVYYNRETVTVLFVAGNPRNDNLQEQTFLSVEKEEDNTWTTIYTDASWKTRFYWKGSKFSPESKAEIQWIIDDNIDPGTYRIRHYGFYKTINGKIHPYNGTTNTFKVINKNMNSVLQYS